MKILIKNANILTMKEENIVQKDILIKDGNIEAIDNFCEETISDVDKIIDAKGNLVMPGIVNTHTHIAMSLFRNYADDLPFWPWLTEKIWPVEEKLVPNDVYWGSLLSISEMIRSGVTCFSDMYFFMDETAKAVETSGIRANLCRGLADGEDEDKKLLEAVDFFKKWNGSCDGRIKVDLGPHAPYTCNENFLKKIINAAKENNCNIHIHLSESKKEVEDSIKEFGKTPIEKMNDCGLFDLRTCAAHCVHLRDNDVKILKEKKVNVLNNPGSNLKLGNGFAPVARLLDEGINVSLGTDGSSSNNNLNMFEEMNLVALFSKGLSGDTTVVPAYTALKMATVNGAIALDRENEIGTIEVGKKADIIMIDLEKPHFYPRFNMISSLVYSAQAGDVKTVIIDGKIIMEDYKILTMDEEEVFKKANQCALDLINRKG